ncbi:CBS domain-containing protein [Candidatus Woesearchaeota archaeon]|nr:CBS domain-containing protein [Candidatus Woesearchaeota archaeon]
MMESGYKVYDAMTTNPISTKKEVTIQEAANVMKENKVSSLVVKDNNKLLGIITERDITRKNVALNLDPSKTLVGDVMTKNAYTIDPKTDIVNAIKKMGDLNKRHLPVVEENGELVGMLTMKDVLRVQPQLFGLIYEGMRIREEARKPIWQTSKEEGICEACGNFSYDLEELGAALLCTQCK